MKRILPFLFLGVFAAGAFFLTRVVVAKRAEGDDGAHRPRVLRLEAGSNVAPDRSPTAFRSTAPASPGRESTPAPMGVGRTNVPVAETCGTIDKVPDQLIERTPFKNRDSFNAFVQANTTKIAGLQMSVDTAMRERVDAARECLYKKHPQAPRMSMKVELEFNLQATPSSIALSNPAVTRAPSDTIPKADLDECLRPVLQPLQINDSGDLYFDYTGPYPYKLVM